MNSSVRSNNKVPVRNVYWWSLLSPSLCTQKHKGKRLILPHSEYQTRKRRQETGQRAVLQPHGQSHYCPGAAVVHSLLGCLTKMDFPSHFPWSNTLQSWSHILVFSSTVVLKDIPLLSLELKPVSKLHCLTTGCKVGEPIVSSTLPMKATTWISPLKIACGIQWERLGAANSKA